MDRAVGALLGLACGDAVGTTVEFQPPGSFEPLTDMVGGGPFRLQPGEWTDDTSMALCLAESILDVGSMDLADQLRRYLMWFDHGYLSSNGRCFDIGITTRAALERFRRTGETSDARPDKKSAANGSLMRLAAVPIRWHADPGEAAAQAALSSLTTHPAERPVDACRLLAAMVAALINGRSAERVLAAEFWRWGPLHPQIAAVAQASWRGKAPPEIRGTGFCVEALEAALWAVGGATDFEEAVLRAANLGDDADTTAAIAGQVAGARWGATGIPRRWRDRLVGRARIEQLARSLFVAGGGVTDGIAWPYEEIVHVWPVADGVLAGEYPGHRRRRRAREKVNLLVDAGIRTFIDLTTAQDRLEPYQPVVEEVAKRRRLDVRRLGFPIPDLGVVDDEVYDDIITAVDAARDRGGVYVHCWGGVGRTGTVIACLLGRDGAGYEATIEAIARARAGTRKAARRAPQTPVQLDLVRRRLAARRELCCDTPLMRYDGVRCAVCNAIDADEYEDGTASCANCGAVLAPDRLDPELLIYPVLVWSWAPCQTCGSTHGEQGGPEDCNCWECGAELLAIKRRACAADFPVESRMGSYFREGAPSVLVGDQGVWAPGEGPGLVGADPFTLLQVTAVRANGDLDVAAIHDGTHWMGLPQCAFLRLY